MAEITLGAVLLINLACALLFAFLQTTRKQPVGVVILFIFLPVIGFLIYYLPQFILKMRGESLYDRDSLVQRISFERSQEPPSMETELNVVPVGDAMAVSSNAAKRTLLLEELKKDIHNNYRSLLAAGEDEDSESVHYVAAAKMEVYRILQDNWIRSAQNYQNYPDDPELFARASQAIQRFIESDLLSDKEQMIFRRKYCDFIKNALEHNNTIATKQDFAYYLICLIRLGKVEEATAFWKQEQFPCKTEQSYFKMMELFYMLKKKEEFYAVLEELRKEEHIRLSPEGLAKMRYWLRKKEDETCSP